MRRFEYHQAETLEQASRLLTELGDDTFLFNGGTDLLVEIRERLRRVRHVVDIKRIPGLSDITYDDQLQRCICVDIRYVLFVMRQSGLAGRLVDELLMN